MALLLLLRKSTIKEVIRWCDGDFLVQPAADQENLPLQAALLYSTIEIFSDSVLVTNQHQCVKNGIPPHRERLGTLPQDPGRFSPNGCQDHQGEARSYTLSSRVLSTRDQQLRAPDLSSYGRHWAKETQRPHRGNFLTGSSLGFENLWCFFNDKEEKRRSI